MEIMYKKVILFGIGILIVCLVLLFFFSKKKKNSAYTKGIKVANTDRIRSSVVYKRLTHKYKFLKGILIAGLIGGFVASLFLVARPYRTDEVMSGVKKRDIILCMDVSYSLYDLNYELTDYLKEVVKGLEGDRIGINIFNTSTVTYVPLTDDYDYVLQKLDELKDYFCLQKEYMEKYDQYDYLPDEIFDDYMELASELEYYDAGTLCDNEIRGSSLVGEGLGTALYSFPYLGEADRTRVIIMCTDNELNALGSEIMNLKQAAKACKNNNVTVFGIFPREEVFYEPDMYDYSTCLGEFRKALEVTGGKCYVRTENRAVSDIVQDIQKEEAMLVKVIMSKQIVDLPQVPFMILFLCLMIVCSVGLVLQR